jgi:hypothetical protein
MLLSNCDTCELPFSHRYASKTTCDKCLDKKRKRAWNESSGNPHNERNPTAHGVIALDGEGIAGKYVLLATSDGSYIENYWDGLGTVKCFDFLLALPQKPLKFGFAFGYDVNMILRDVEPKNLQDLRSKNQTVWNNYYIQHFPSKMFRVKNRSSGISITIWDQFPFVQSSFVKFLRQFGLAPEEEILRIAEMKDQRSDFGNVDPYEIRQYCISECKYLQKGVEHFLELYEGLGYRPANYYSPGTLAALELHKQEVLGHYEPAPNEIRPLIDRGYFGGRAEASRVGPITGTHWQYDINSAYPFAATLCHCLRHGRWISDRRDIVPSGIYKVRFRISEGQIWGPFPVRPVRGSLKYPYSGETCIWGIELLAALPILSDLEILEGYRFETTCTHSPFSYLSELYVERIRLKDAGDAREYVLKLILNSTYGKLAQRKAFNGTKPRFQSLEWAGLITATTRAMLLSQLVEGGNSIYLLATDSILSSEPLFLPTAKGLGFWEPKELGDCFIVGAGFYFATDGDGKPVAKTRGIRAGSVNYSEIVAAWEGAGKLGEYPCRINRFIGYSLALQRVEGFSKWRHFVSETVTKRFSLEPRRQWLNDDPFDGRTLPPSEQQVEKAGDFDRMRSGMLGGFITHYAKKGDTDHLISALLVRDSHDHPEYAELPDDQPDHIIDQIQSKKVNHAWE